MAAQLQQNAPFTLEYEFVALVDAVMAERDDARILAFGRLRRQHFRIGIERVAMHDRREKPDIVEAEFGKRVLACILACQPHDEREIDAAIGDALLEWRELHHMLVEMRLRRIHHEVRDEHVLKGLDRFARACRKTCPASKSSK